MSTSPVSTTGARPSRGTDPLPVGTARIRVVQAVLSVGALAAAGFLVVRPGAARTDRSYAAVAAGRDAAWLGHLVECLGYGLLGIGLALAACLIARRRGAVWATVGGVMVALGGLFWAAMAYAVGAFDWYATATAALPEASGSALLAYAQDHPERLVVADLAGFVLFTLGSLLVCVGLWRSRAVPKALPITIVVLTLAQFALPQTRVFDLAQAALVLSLGAVAAFAGRCGD